jgi:dephospho-CoA kinase
LGEGAYISEDKLNREFISKKIFSDSTLLSKINGIIHPAVEEDFKTFLNFNKEHTYVIKETALLFETGLYKKVDKIVLVMAPMELRLLRVKMRDGLNEDEIYKRIRHQMPDEEKQPISDFVILNDEKTGLIPQVIDINSKLINA